METCTTSGAGKLTREIELQLVSARDSGDPKAAGRLATYVEPIMKAEAARYSSGWKRVDPEDLLRAAWLGALKAAAAFTGKRAEGNNSNAPGFPAYAAVMIRSAISDELRRTVHPVDIAEDVWKRKARANPADIAAAESWNVTEELDAPTEEGYALHETIEAPAGVNTDLKLDLELAMHTLNDQERRVIRGVLNDEPMSDVAAALGVTPSRVTRIKTAAYAKLAAALEGYRPAESNPARETPLSYTEGHTLEERAPTGASAAQNIEGEIDDTDSSSSSAADPGRSATVDSTNRCAGTTRATGSPRIAAEARSARDQQVAEHNLLDSEAPARDRTTGSDLAGAHHRTHQPTHGHNLGVMVLRDVHSPKRQPRLTMSALLAHEQPA